ncbi:MAG: sn-glycerol-3-phosphate transporter ATP-binding protein UgpC [Pseudomonadota bacterium]|jgi:multiple sugar transport system ATP-binding protein
MARIELNNVFKAYGDHAPVIRDVTLDIGENEFCVFVGPSGCGKSTLLRMVAGLEVINSGELRIGGQRMNDVAPAQRGVAMVFQSYALFPHMTVFENMAFGLRLSKVPEEQLNRRVREAARILQLEPLLERLPKALSGGQRQRVAIGRAIVREPGVFLFDEPLSNLDAALRVQTRFEIAKIHRDFGKASTVYVTHDQVEAMTLADRIVLLNAGEAVARDGSVAQFGAPLELYHRPCNKFVAGFIGSPKMNFLEGSITATTPEVATVKLQQGEILQVRVNASALAVGSAVTIGLRPEYAEVGTASQHISRTVQWQERLGESTYLYLDSGVAGAPWVVKAPGNSFARAGERMAMALPPQHLHLFDAQGRAMARTVANEDLPLATMPVAA